MSSSSLFHSGWTAETQWTHLFASGCLIVYNWFSSIDALSIISATKKIYLPGIWEKSAPIFHIGLKVTPWKIVVVATNYGHNWGSGYYNSIKRVLQFLLWCCCLMLMSLVVGLGLSRRVGKKIIFSTGSSSSLKVTRGTSNKAEAASKNYERVWPHNQQKIHRALLFHLRKAPSEAWFE